MFENDCRLNLNWYQIAQEEKNYYLRRACDLNKCCKTTPTKIIPPATIPKDEPKKTKSPKNFRVEFDRGSSDALNRIDKLKKILDEPISEYKQKSGQSCSSIMNQQMERLNNNCKEMMNLIDCLTGRLDGLEKKIEGLNLN
ncbi:hypothetical protein SNEBB_000854 [Seison nebaliae]|nr:hypothetical protein SNEBB_000854 [Seison nebaliae]